jgi:hypothetical protein
MNPFLSTKSTLVILFLIAPIIAGVLTFDTLPEVAKSIHPGDVYAKKQQLPSANDSDSQAAFVYANAQYNELCVTIDSLQDLLNKNPIDYKIFKKTNNDSVTPLPDSQYQIFTHLENLRKERKEIEYAIDSIKLVIAGKDTLSTEKPKNQR